MVLFEDFIRKCHNVIDVINSIEESFGYDFHILVEEFIFGCEVDLDILIQDNEVKFMAITDNFPAKAPFFFEQGIYNLFHVFEYQNFEF